jgi:hypothetical protein
MASLDLEYEILKVKKFQWKEEATAECCGNNSTLLTINVILKIFRC